MSININIGPVSYVLCVCHVLTLVDTFSLGFFHLNIAD